MAARLGKTMTLPINGLFDFLQNKITVQVWLYENVDLRLEGKIIGFDEYMNVVLDDTEEIYVKKGTRKKIGRILLKGDNITAVFPAPTPSN